MHFVHRRILRGVLFVIRHPWITLAAIVLTVALCIIFAARFLTISTDQNKLFSSKPWYFHDYLQYTKEFPENEAVYIVVQPKDDIHPTVAQWTAAADSITDRLRASPEVKAAYCKIPLDQLGRQAILFENPKQLPQRLADARGLQQLAELWGGKSTPLTSALGPNPIQRMLAASALHADRQTTQFLSQLVDSWNWAILHPHENLSVGHGVIDFRAVTADTPTQLGYYFVPDEIDRSHWRILVVVYPQRNFNSLTSVARTIDAIRRVAKDAGDAYPLFDVSLAGRPVLEADQMQASDADSHKAETLALIVVFIGMALMLRSLWLALAAEICLGVGIAWTFGWATAAIGQLNLLSLVFLIALIGIGMDYLVQILMRYRLEARRYQRASAIWTRVFRYIGPPITTACLGAAGAFFVAVFTYFRGAAELGVIAGGGLLLCLLAGYTALPAMLTIFPPRLKPFDVSRRFKPQPTVSAGWLALPVVWIALLLAGIPYMAKAHFDPGLIDLQVPNLKSVQLIRTLQTWVAVVTSKNLDELRAARAAVVKLPVVASTDSILNAMENDHWLSRHSSQLPSIDWTRPQPVTASALPAISAQARRLSGALGPIDKHAADVRTQFADNLRRLPDPAAAAAQLSSWQDIFVSELRGLIDEFHPGPLDLAAVPHQLRSHYVSDDGVYALYIYPAKDLWNNANLNKFESSVEAAVDKSLGPHRVTGIASNVYHTTGAIHAAFFHSTIYALVLIFVLVLLDFRRLGPTLAAISVLAMGLPMLVIVMGIFGTSWNFANFFGLPIIIGAAHEYGVFMVHRYLEAVKYPRRSWRRWDVSDRALLLCAFITSSSFGFFWLLAEHRGLKSLGLVMGVGAACIYLATLMVLRPILKWRLGRIIAPPSTDDII